MITLTFPDGAKRQFQAGVSGAEIAKGISPSLLKRTVAMALDGKLADLSDADQRVMPRSSSWRAMIRARSSSSATTPPMCSRKRCRSSFPGTQVTIGPVIENGFYYDFARNQPFTPDDFPRDREEDARDHRARPGLSRSGGLAREGARPSFPTRARTSRSSSSMPSRHGQPIKIYDQGDWIDLCRGPHMTSTGKIGDAFQLMKVAGAYWRGDSNNPMLTRIYGTAFAKRDDLDAYLKQLEEAERRDHRRLGREMDLFHFQEEGPGVVFWHAKGWTLFQQLIAYMRRRLAGDYQEVNAPQILDKSSGRLRAIGIRIARTCSSPRPRTIASSPSSR